MTAVAQVLPPGSRRRSIAVLALVAVAVLFVTQVLLPGSQASARRGTPAAFLFTGLLAGLTTAVTAAGIVLIYRTLRVINFAQAAIGVAGAVLTFEFVQFTPVPFPIAVLLGIALSVLIGVVAGFVNLAFLNAPRLFVTVFTIVLANTLFVLGNQVRNLPFFPDAGLRTTADQEAAQNIARFLPFPGWEFTVGGFTMPFGFRHVFALELAVVTLVALGAFFRWTRAGTAVRGLAENPERASLLGIGVGGLTVAIWGLAGGLAGVGVITRGLVLSPASATSPEAGFAVLLPALTAAVLGRMQSLPIAVGASVALGVLSSAWNFSIEGGGPLFNAFMLLLIMGGLLLHRSGISRSERSGGTSWEAAEEQRPIPNELRSVGVVRNTRLALIGLGVIAVVAFPFFATTRTVNLAGVVAITAIAVISMVVLTGWAGQVSLGQGAFVAIGAVVGGSLMTNTFLNFWLAVPLAAAITGAIALVVGIPALRIPGLFLLVATFAFAVVVRATLFDQRYFGWLLPEDVPRPTLFFIDFDNERAMYFLSIAALVLAIVMVQNLRRSRMGRLLIALRENEQNVQAFGVSAVRTKLMAFAASGALAGYAGAIFSSHQLGVSADSFGADASVFLFIAAVFGGVSSVAGALLGTAFFRGVQDLVPSFIVQQVLQNGGTLLILLFVPAGLIGLVNQARDSLLRIVAQRRQIVVPSLFADYDPEAMANRLAPLSPADDNSGLAVLPGDRRYVLRSELYRGKGERLVDRMAPARATAEEAAIRAAARSAEDAEDAVAAGEAEDREIVAAAPEAGR
jgi:branched-chain amino acid transport system permease protein